MIALEKIETTLETLEALKSESVAAKRFEEAVVYDNAKHQIEKRDPLLPTWPSNRPIA